MMPSELPRRLAGRAAALAAAILVSGVACGDEILPPPPSRLVAIRIVADPDLDTLHLSDSLALTAVPDTGPAPMRVRWSLSSSGGDVTTDTFVYRPAAAGTELIRAVAEFTNGATGSAERRTVTRPNRAPVVSITVSEVLGGVSLPGFGTRLRAGADSVVLLGTASDPDGDPIPPESLAWTATLGDSAWGLGTGETVRFGTTAVGAVTITLSTADRAGARGRAHRSLYVFDPITPPRWRVRFPASVATLTQATNGDVIALGVDGTLARVDREGRLLWTDSLASFSVPVAVGPAGDAYLGVRDLISISPNGTTNWALPETAAATALFGPAIFADGSLAVPTGASSSTDGMRRVSAAGDVLWTAALDGIDLIRSLAIGRDSTVYLAARNLVGSSRAAVVALAPDGTVKWSTSLGLGSGPAGSVIVAGDSTLLVIYDSLYAMGVDGTVRWSVPTPTSVPVVGTADVAFYREANTLRAISLSNGTTNWITPLPPAFQSAGSQLALAADGRVFVPQGRLVVGYDGGTGAEVWRHETYGHVTYQPLITEQGDLVITDSVGFVEAVALGAGPLDSPWPQMWATPQRTGRVRR